MELSQQQRIDSHFIKSGQAGVGKRGKWKQLARDISAVESSADSPVSWPL